MDFITVPIGWLLKFFSTVCGNSYILAILLFSIVMEILMALIFGIKQQKNSIKQARLRPKEMAIRNKYKGRDDKPTQQKMTQEIQELYQKEGYNPMGGCLPLLIQFPLLIALYNIVINPLKYICGLTDNAIGQIATILGMDTSRGTMSFLGPIADKGYDAFRNVEGFTVEIFENMPNLKAFGGVLDLSVMPSSCMNLDALKSAASWFVLAVPVLTFISYFFSMKLTRKFSYQPVDAAQQQQMGCSNKMMDVVMPLFSVFISFGVPAALGIYWIFKSILGVISKVILFYAIPIPKFTEEDYKAAEKELAGKNKNKPVKKERDPNAPRPRSLHHIDDEDYDEKGNYIAPAKEPEVSADKTPVDAAPMKKDDKKNKKKADDEKVEEASETPEADN